MIERHVRSYVDSQRSLVRALEEYGPAIARDIQCHRELCEEGAGVCVIVDDEPMLLRITERYLDKAGWRVEAFSEYAQAEEYLKSHIPEVAVLDVQLEGDKTGVALSAAVNRCTRLYLISGVVSQAKLLDALAQSCGAEGALLKGKNTPLELVNTIGTPRRVTC